MEESIFGPREIRKKLDTDAKDGGTTTKRGSTRRWFHYSFILPCWVHPELIGWPGDGAAATVSRPKSQGPCIPKYAGVTVYMGPSMR